MNIAVCIKQTPIVSEARFNPETKTLVREGVTLTISSLDRRAVLEALRLRHELGGTVTVLTMGPPQARSALLECLALGADRAIHLTDRAFAGADTIATARTLSMALRRLQPRPDLILCGKFTVDSETGQVPSMIAEFLDLPQVTSVRKIRPQDGGRTLWVERETDEGYEHYEVPLPAVLSTTEWIVLQVRRPSPEELAAAESKPLDVWTAADLGVDPSAVGLAGSPTWVADLRTIPVERTPRILADLDPQAAAKEVARYLLDHGLFRPRETNMVRRPRRAAPRTPDPAGAIWVVAELLDGTLRPVTLELLGKAQELADRSGGEVAAVLMGGPGIVEHVATLGAYGADTVYLAEDERLATYSTELYSELLATAVRRLQPAAVLLPSTTNGRDLAPRVAARLQVGLTGDCIGLEVDSDGEIAMLKPSLGGMVVAPIYSKTKPVMATVRPGMLEAVEPDWNVRPQVVPLATPNDVAPRVRLLEHVNDPDLGATKLDKADVVVSVGLGIGGPENLPTVRELANVLDAALAGSLRVVVAGWLPYQLQVGLTGRAIAPRFYIAIGISGQPNHQLGIKKAEHVIVINNDPAAPFFQNCDLGVIGDWAQVVPALTAELRRAKEAMSA